MNEVFESPERAAVIQPRVLELFVFTSKDVANRENLTGVYVEPTRAFATDGHRATIVNQATDLGACSRLFIPREIAEAAAKATRKRGAPFAMLDVEARTLSVGAAQWKIPETKHVPPPLDQITSTVDYLSAKDMGIDARYVSDAQDYLERVEGAKAVYLDACSELLWLVRTSGDYRMIVMGVRS